MADASLAQQGQFQLSADQLQHFNTEGWVGPFNLLTSPETNELVPELERCFSQTRGYFYPPELEPGVSYYKDTPWFQSLHALSEKICNIGMRPEIVDRVEQLLGSDIILWGGIRFAQAPGEALHWHSDTEFDHVSGVSIWLGVQGVTPENALKIIPGSDQFSQMPEDYQVEGSLSMDQLLSDDLALCLAAECNSDAQIVRPKMKDGEFFIFKGKTWHASDNNSDKNRLAMGLRYSTANNRVRIPLTYLHPIQWDSTPPPCVLVRGQDEFKLNRIVAPPKK